MHGHPHRVWVDSRGREVIEEYSIAGLGHGTPLDTRAAGDGDKAAPFMLEAGISSTRLIAKYWNIVPDQAGDRRSAAPKARLQQPNDTAKAQEALHGPVPEAIGQTIEQALRSAGLMR